MKKKPFGKQTPWVWSIELVRGCNLACWHCTARLHTKNDKIKYMSEKTWINMCKIMEEMTPNRRLELAQGGEPTLHPKLLKFLKIAKEIAPSIQIQVTTNGLTLLNKKLTFDDLFNAGANSVYVDTYNSIDKFTEMAKNTEYEWYHYNDHKIGTENHKIANTYYNDKNMKLIILQGNPENRYKWRKQGRLSTFLNHIEWAVAMPNGLFPVREPYKRRCTMPLRYVSTSFEGDYLFCCIDFWCETAGLIGNVNDGISGFKKFWFGKLMQTIRKQLSLGLRENIPYCSRCNCAFSKCDFTKIWDPGSYENWFDGENWIDLLPIEKDNEIFNDGWEKAKNLKIPSIEKEKEIIENSPQYIINNNNMAAKKKKIDGEQICLFELEGNDET
jgi:organic radical activating enzyme